MFNFLPAVSGLATITLIGAALLTYPDTALANANRLAINHDAPTVASTELMIDAPTAAVWTVLTDVGRWPSWISEIASARIDGPVAPGSTIYWEPFGQKVESRLVLVEPLRKLTWNGTDGAVHVWELVPIAGGTLLRNSESIDHWKAAKKPTEGSGMLSQLLSAWNRRLAEQAQRLGK